MKQNKFLKKTVFMRKIFSVLGKAAVSYMPGKNDKIGFQREEVLLEVAHK